MEKLILLVDDDPDEFFILQQAVSQSDLGYHCMWAESAAKADALLHQWLPDLILIDYNMPVTNGIICLQNIRTLHKLADVPIVMYSTHISDVTRELALTRGASCLQKPSTVSQLVQYLISFSGAGKAFNTIKDTVKSLAVSSNQFTNSSGFQAL